MYGVSDAALMINACGCVDDSVVPNLSPEVDDDARAHYRPRVHGCGGIKALSADHGRQTQGLTVPEGKDDIRHSTS